MKKFLENIWYHYKIYLLLALLVIGLAVIMIVGLVNRKAADLQVIVYTKASMSSAEIKKLEDSFISRISDYNGDGGIAVDIIAISYGSDISDTMQQKLLVEMTQGNAYIVLCEEGGVRDILNYSGIIQDVSRFEKGYVKYDNRALLIQRNAVLDIESSFYDEELYMFLRNISFEDKVKADLEEVIAEILNYEATAEEK